MLQEALHRLFLANQNGWGAYVAVGLRKPGLSRWRRGGLKEVIALPALFVDVDDPSDAALWRLQKAAPSCIVASGGGYHAYWWLDRPTTDLHTAKSILHGMAVALNGDSLSPAQSMRLIGSRNTKPGRENALCHLITLTHQRYKLADFTHFISPQPSRPRFNTANYDPDTNLIDNITTVLLAQGFKRSGDWLNGSCLYPHHHNHQYRSPSFGFNT